jgi:hypothetical protein
LVDGYTELIRALVRRVIREAVVLPQDREQNNPGDDDTDRCNAAQNDGPTGSE